MSPTDSEWQNVDGKLVPTWFFGNQFPEAYENFIIIPDILGNTVDIEAQDDREIDQVESNIEQESSDKD
ncbi:hypothetical protein HHI36_014613 [Cryptolaemus montrouzieri]|uniref:Uncharacterized protein n=1 Tax=Cryptolaemus montrouzieri TaxID=559131 RepID=A0ABD2N3F6_9CUCU